MLKKIIYYGFTLSFGVLYVLVLFSATYINRVDEVCEDAIESEDYINIARIYSNYINSSVVYLNDDLDDDTVIVIYETSSVCELEEDDEYTSLVEMYYSMYIINSDLDLVDTQDSVGNTINGGGFSVSSSSKTFSYTLKEAESLVNYSALVGSDIDGIVNIHFPKTYINEELGSTTIKEISITNSDGSIFTTISGLNFSYDSLFYDEMELLADQYTTSLNDTSDDAQEVFDTFYSEWSTDYSKTSTFLYGYSITSFLSTGNYVSIFAGIAAYIIVIVLVADFIVGKKRIKKWIVARKEKKNNSDVIDAQIVE